MIFYAAWDWPQVLASQLMVADGAKALEALLWELDEAMCGWDSGLGWGSEVFDQRGCAVDI